MSAAHLPVSSICSRPWKAERQFPQSIAGSCSWTSKWLSNWLENALHNTLPHRAHSRAVGRAECRPDSSSRRQAFRALPPLPTPFRLQNRLHPRVSRSRPHNHMTEGVSGKLGGGDKTWVTDRYGRGVRRSAGKANERLRIWMDDGDGVDMTSTGGGERSETGRRHGKARSGRWSGVSEAGKPSCGREGGRGGREEPGRRRRSTTMGWAVETGGRQRRRAACHRSAGRGGRLGHHVP